MTQRPDNISAGFSSHAHGVQKLLFLGSSCIGARVAYSEKGIIWR